MNSIINSLGGPAMAVVFITAWIAAIAFIVLLCAAGNDNPPKPDNRGGES